MEMIILDTSRPQIPIPSSNDVNPHGRAENGERGFSFAIFAIFQRVSRRDRVVDSGEGRRRGNNHQAYVSRPRLAESSRLRVVSCGGCTSRTGGGGEEERASDDGKCRQVLINYSVGVAPFKIKIGSLSGATWNFFLIRPRDGEGRGGGSLWSPATGFLCFAEGAASQRPNLAEPDEGIRLARSYA